jgi:glycosyltransferase involved in cell wall biosynthesis
VKLPTIRSKYLDTVVHTALSSLHLVLTRGPRDVVLCNAANAPVLLLLRLFRRRVVLNVDGLEWRRAKWGIAGRSWYRMGEWLSVRLASVLVTDADEVQTYYRVRHDTDSVMIPYGADLLARGSLAVPAEAPVQPDRYALYVSRWERENNPLMVARAHAASGVDLDLVMLGAATYDEDLGAQVRAAAGPRSHLPGAVFGPGYQGLQVNAACYVHATEVGGTHPALIEAMGAGNLCLVLDTPENREVVGSAGVFFADERQLVEALRWAASLEPAERDAWRGRAREHAAAHYSWDAVTASYLTLLRG